MQSTEVFRALAEVSAALVADYDISHVTTTVLHDVAEAVGADAAGVLVLTRGGGVELLGATSHAAAELEAYQTSADRGPCLACLRTGASVTVRSTEDAEERWPGVGTAMTSAGFGSAYAAPMRWQGTVVGGLNLFWRDGADLPEDGGAHVVQTFADVLTLALVSVEPVSAPVALGRIGDAVAGRALVEVAKGVLAEQERLDMSSAYERLVALAAREGLSLGLAAQRVVSTAAERRGQSAQG